MWGKCPLYLGGVEWQKHTRKEANGIYSCWKRKENRARNLNYNIHFLFLFKEPARQNWHAGTKCITSVFSSSLVPSTLLLKLLLVLVLFFSEKQSCPPNWSTFQERSMAQAQASSLSRKALLTLVLVKLREQNVSVKLQSKQSLCFASLPGHRCPACSLPKCFMIPDHLSLHLGNSFFWKIKDCMCYLSQWYQYFKREFLR